MTGVQPSVLHLASRKHQTKRAAAAATPTKTNRPCSHFKTSLRLSTPPPPPPLPLPPNKRTKQRRNERTKERRNEGTKEGRKEEGRNERTNAAHQQHFGACLLHHFHSARTTPHRVHNARVDSLLLIHSHHPPSHTVDNRLTLLTTASWALPITKGRFGVK